MLCCFSPILPLTLVITMYRLLTVVTVVTALYLSLSVKFWSREDVSSSVTFVMDGAIFNSKQHNDITCLPKNCQQELQRQNFTMSSQ
jgi:hypothetical protein